MAFNVSHKQTIAYFNNKLISEWLPGLYWHILITAYIVKNIRTAFETPTAAPYRLLEHSSPLPTEQFHTVSHTSGKRCKICRPDSGSESSDVRWNNLTLYPQNPIGRVRVPSRGGGGWGDGNKLVVLLPWLHDDTAAPEALILAAIILVFTLICARLNH